MIGALRVKSSEKGDLFVNSGLIRFFFSLVKGLTRIYFSIDHVWDKIIEEHLAPLLIVDK